MSFPVFHVSSDSHHLIQRDGGRSLDDMHWIALKIMCWYQPHLTFIMCLGACWMMGLSPSQMDYPEVRWPTFCTSLMCLDLGSTQQEDTEMLLPPGNDSSPVPKWYSTMAHDSHGMVLCKYKWLFLNIGDRGKQCQYNLAWCFISVKFLWCTNWNFSFRSTPWYL